MKIKIIRDKWGSLFAMDGIYPLFQFEYRKSENRWLFWLRGDYDPAIFIGRDFPVKFFVNACRAKHFIMFADGCDNGFVDMPGKVEITEGADYITGYIKKRILRVTIGTELAIV